MRAELCFLPTSLEICGLLARAHEDIRGTSPQTRDRTIGTTHQPRKRAPAKFSPLTDMMTISITLRTSRKQDYLPGRQPHSR